MLTNKRNIKDFKIEGVAKDQEAIIRVRKELEDRIIEDMRERGYVPVIDLLPQLYWEYNRAEEQFDYVVIVYGQYVGKSQSKQIMGILDSRKIAFPKKDEKEG